MTARANFVATAIAFAICCGAAHAGSLLDEARIAFNDLQYETAIERCKEATKEDSVLDSTERVEAEIILAKSLLKTNRASEALSIAEKAASTQSQGDALDRLHRIQSEALVEIEGLSDRTIKLFSLIDSDASTPETRSANLLDWAQACVDAGINKDAIALLVQQSELNCTNATLADGMILHSQLLAYCAEPGFEPDPENIVAATNLLETVSSANWAKPQQRVLALIKLAQIVDVGMNDVSLACDYAEKALAAAISNADDLIAIELSCGNILIKNPSYLDKGAKTIKSAIAKLNDEDIASGAQLNLANAYLKHGCFTNAFDEFIKYSDVYTNNLSKAYHGYARACLGKGDYVGAARGFHKAALESTGDFAASCYLDEAKALIHAQDYPEAETCLLKISGDFPGTEAANIALTMRADALERSGKQEAALDAFSTAAKNSTNSTDKAEAFYRQGLIRERMKDADGAIRCYSLAISSLEAGTGNSVTNALLQATAKLARGRVRVASYRDGALIDLNVACDTPATKEEASYLKIKALYNQKLDAEAASACMKFLTEFPESRFWIDAQLWLAKYYYNDLTDYRHAEEMFLGVASHDSSNFWADAALIWAGRSAMRRADYSDAAAIFEKFDGTYSNSTHIAEAKFFHADVLIEMARFTDAIFQLDEIIDKWPDSDWATSALGRKGDCHFSLGATIATHYDEAKAAYTSVKTRPNVPFDQELQAEFKIGRCLEKQGHADEARKQYYEHVILRFESAGKLALDENAQTWYSRAAFQLADLPITKGDTESAVTARKILERIAKKGVVGSEEARARLTRLNGK